MFMLFATLHAMPRCRLLDDIYFIHNCFYATQPYTLLEPKCLSTITYAFVHHFLLPYEATSPNTVAHCTPLFRYSNTHRADFFTLKSEYSVATIVHTSFFPLPNTHVFFPSQILTQQNSFVSQTHVALFLRFFSLTNTQPVFLHTTHVESMVE